MRASTGLCGRVGVLLFSFLLITLVSQMLYRTSISSLHDSLLSVIDTAEVIHEAENFHSATHMMLLSATTRGERFPFSHSQEYQKNRLAARSILDTFAAGENGPSGHKPAARTLVPYASTLTARYEEFSRLTDGLMEASHIPTTIEKDRAEESFGTLFKTYLQVLHVFHDGRLDEVKKGAHAILAKVNLTFFVQLILLAASGALAMLLSNKAIVRPFAEAETEAATDRLTGLSNRRYLDDVAAVDFGDSIARNRRFSLALMDIDHFKLLNDSHGHQAGDEVLRKVARLLKQELREGDSIVRYGGEEFLILMPGASMDGALRAIENTRAKLERCGIYITMAAEPLLVTASFGVASSPDDNGDFYSLIAIADARLYTAKSAGRNRVIGSPNKARSAPSPIPRNQHP